MTEKRALERGFTLVELLVVIVIIALLVSILVPSLNRAQGQARARQCGVNLHNIQVAWTKCHADTSMASRAVIHWIWTLQVFEHLARNPLALLCPEDDKPSLSGFDGIAVRCWRDRYGAPDQYFDMDVFSNLDSYGSGEPGDGNQTWRVNEEEYKRLTGLRNSGTVDMRSHLTEYAPGTANPNVSYLLFDDQRSGEKADYDFWDCHVRLEQTGPSSYAYSASHQVAGYDFKLVGPDGNPMGDWLRNSEASGSTEGLPTSYGASNAMTQLRPGHAKILLLDYRRSVAEVVGDDGHPADFDEDKAPRHNGKCNVVFADGAVKLRSPTAIDPNQPDMDKLWEPQQ